jgi:hypothetical protein
MTGLWLAPGPAPLVEQAEYVAGLARPFDRFCGLLLCGTYLKWSNE